MGSLRAKVSANLANQIHLLLSENLLETVGDTTGQRRTLERGVLYGSPLSPALFNVYIDTLMAEVNLSGLQTAQVNLFADDVAAFTTTGEETQRFIDTCGRWAQEYGMEWSVGKCSIIPRTDVPVEHRTLSGQVVVNQVDAEYLGVTISSGQITTKRAVKRVEKAAGRLQILRRSFSSAKFSM